MTLEEKPPLFETLACVYFFNNDVIKGFFYPFPYIGNI